MQPSPWDQSWPGQPAGHDSGRPVNSCSHQPPLPTHLRRHTSLNPAASDSFGAAHILPTKLCKKNHIFSLYSQKSTTNGNLTQQSCGAETRMHRMERHSRLLHPWKMEETYLPRTEEQAMRDMSTKRKAMRMTKGTCSALEKLQNSG